MYANVCHCSSWSWRQTSMCEWLSTKQSFSSCPKEMWWTALVRKLSVSLEDHPSVVRVTRQVSGYSWYFTLHIISVHMVWKVLCCRKGYHNTGPRLVQQSPSFFKSNQNIHMVFWAFAYWCWKELRDDVRRRGNITSRWMKALVLPTDEEVGGMWMLVTFDLEKWVYLNSPQPLFVW